MLTRRSLAICRNLKIFGFQNKAPHEFRARWFVQVLTNFGEKTRKLTLRALADYEWLIRRERPKPR